jgi:pyrroline-5-carboxylate reductase
MGSAILRGWLASGVDPRTISVIDPALPSVPGGVRVLPAPPRDEAAPSVLVLCVKPQALDAVAPVVAPLLSTQTVLLSILAGVEIDSLRARFGAPTHVVRVMPNMPASIGAGVTALFTVTQDSAKRDQIAGLVQPLGHVEWIGDENLFDAVTAVSGCGPAFVFRFIDALAEAGTALGLPVDQAVRLALNTVKGAALMAAQSTHSPATLADQVASPGGSTREGLNVLDADGALKPLMHATLAASARRNAELAAAARG